jgi:hypothetical protein
MSTTHPLYGRTTDTAERPPHVVVAHEQTIKDPHREDSEDDRAFALATHLVLQQKYGEGIETLRRLARRYPHRRAEAEHGIGAAYLFLGSFRKAFAHFITAREHGFDPIVTDDYAWEACDGARRRGDPSLLEAYLEHYPDGRNATRARALLG